MGNNFGTATFNDEMIAEYANLSGLSENQVREKCCAWLYEHPDGKLGRDCFSEMIRETLPDFTAEEAERVELHVFRIYDTNGDGVISFHEFMTVFMILTGDEPRTVLEKMFLIFDVDNSGLITKDNMLTLVTDLHKLFLDPAHPEPEQTDAELATRAFREMDTDRDGLVTREEFVSAILEREKFSSFLAAKIFNIFG